MEELPRPAWLEQHYTPKQVADLLHVSDDTILRRCREGALHSILIPSSRLRRIPESALREWLTSGSTTKGAA